MNNQITLLIYTNPATSSYDTSSYVAFTSTSPAYVTRSSYKGSSSMAATSSNPAAEVKASFPTGEQTNHDLKDKAGHYDWLQPPRRPQ